MIGKVYGTVAQPLVFEGYANDFDKAIAGIEFSLDDGTTWSTYRVDNATPERNLYWKFEYIPERCGTYELLIRSVNEDGTASPEPARVSFVVLDKEAAS